MQQIRGIGQMFSSFHCGKRKPRDADTFVTWLPAPCLEPNKETEQFQTQPLPSIHSPSPRASPILFFSLPHIPSELDVNKLITDEQGAHLLRF